MKINLKTIAYVIFGGICLITIYTEFSDAQEKRKRNKKATEAFAEEYRQRYAVNKYPTKDEDSVYYYFNKKQIQENDGIISSEPVDELSYDFIRNNYEFIGKWKMKWTLDVLKGNKEPILEFYLSDSPDFWFQVWTENTIVIKKLIKEGSKYTRKPESQQDYYLVTKKGELRSYDDNGYIGPEAGFKYVKMR
mgnify:CR=1 FL=1